MRTTPLLATAWAGAATVAVGLGFFAVGLLDADPIPAAAASTVTGTPEVTPTAGAPSSTSTTLTGQQVTDGGTVYGSCTDGVAQLGSAPAAGWTVDDSSTVTAVELESGDRRIHVTATCGPAGPVFVVSSDGDDDTPAVTPAPSVSPAPTPDDHGSDDDVPEISPSPTTDDHGSGGHGSGGHGSDD